MEKLAIAVYCDRVLKGDNGLNIVIMILNLLCGVALFLYGMSLMGDGLKSVAGDKLEAFLYKMTNTPIKGLLLGTAVTSVIQSSSATSVMVVGFVNSGMMKLFQAIGIIVGANIGTSITGWILCLSYVGGSSGIAKLFSSATIAAVAAIAGTVLKMVSKRSSGKHLGSILLGFAILMVGMQMMSSAVSPLRESPVFTKAMTMFSNPVLGIALGIVMTAILQSASASIGVTQALSVTGILTFSTAFPVILGIGVGASCPVLFSAIGANKNGQRSALVYLLINVFNMILCGAGFYAVNAFMHFSFMEMTVGPVEIAFVNSLVRIVGGVILFPFFGAIEKLVCRLIKDSPEDLEDMQDNADFDLLDERFLVSPALALAQSSRAVYGMSGKVRKNVGRSLNLIHEFSEKKFAKVQRKEDLIDKYESRLGSYLMQLTKLEMTSEQTREATAYLRLIGDFERIGDYASNIARVTNRMHDENIQFSQECMRDLNMIIQAERDIVNSTVNAFKESDLETAMGIKPFSAVISSLCEILKARHIGRLTRGECGITQGAVYNELLNSFERIASHCVAVSGMVRRAHQSNPDFHVHSSKARELTEEEYQHLYNTFQEKYDVIKNIDHPLSIEDEAVQ